MEPYYMNDDEWAHYFVVLPELEELVEHIYEDVEWPELEYEFPDYCSIRTRVHVAKRLSKLVKGIYVSPKMLDGVLDGLRIDLEDTKEYYDMVAFCEGDGYFLNGEYVE